MLSINELSVGYGKQLVIDNLNLEIQSNSIHGLVGLNGAGKTTLLSTIYGLKKQNNGRIEYHKKKVSREQIAFLETNNYFYPKITGKEYLNIFKTRNVGFDINKWNIFFELPLNKLIDNYSTGMKKKLALMGVLCLNREILILDEPFNGVDLETVQKLKSLLTELKSKKLILITSHILESLTNICNRISYLNNGLIEFSRNKSDFKNLESDIFSTHQNNIDVKVKELLSGM